MNLLQVLAKSSTNHRIVLEPMIVQLPGDLETPVSAYLKLERVGARFLLESAESAHSMGRYTFIGIAPAYRVDILRDGSRVTGSEENLWIEHDSSDKPFTALRRILARLSLKGGDPELGLIGGLVGYLGYDCVSILEPRIPSNITEDTILGSFYFADSILVFDHFLRRIKIILLHQVGDAESKQRCERLLESVKSALREPVPVPTVQVPPSNGALKANLTQAEFERIVEESKRNIRAGEVFQIVPSQVLTGETGAASFEIYRALRMLNPSPYMFYVDFDSVELIGSSPETLVKLEGSQATVRPIAGTRRRGRTITEDATLAAELLADEKERAEHVMLVDLGRNDLGRISEFGSVRVSEFTKLDYFSHVMHMTSTVTGRVRDGADQFDLLRATFPAGTVTGAPKVRAMELISQLEPTPRGPYAGCVGYFSLSGDMDMCISIRTIVKRNRTVFLQAGAGIVADSIPEMEYKETLNKIAAIKQSVRLAERGL